MPPLSRTLPALVCAAMVLAAAAPAEARYYGSDDDFTQTYDVEYGQGSTQGAVPFHAFGVRLRQDLYRFFGYRVGVHGFLGREKAVDPLKTPGFGLSGDLLASTGNLIPGVQPYVALGGVGYNTYAGKDQQLNIRATASAGLRLFGWLQLEGRAELNPTSATSAGLTGLGMYGSFYFNPED